MTQNAREIGRKITLLADCEKKLREIQHQLEDDPQGDPREVADASALFWLYLEKKIYLIAMRNLPLRKERLEELFKQVANPEVGFEEYNQCESDVNRAERTIREWNEAEWKRSYQDIEARILARPESKLKMFLVEEDTEPPAPFRTQHTLTELFPKSETLRALADAVFRLGPDASARRVCEYVDDHETLDLPKKFMTKGNVRSFEDAYHESPAAKKAIDNDVSTAKKRLRAAGYFPPSK
jgi:hypothetical protein